MTCFPSGAKALCTQFESILLRSDAAIRRGNDRGAMLVHRARAFPRRAPVSAKPMRDGRFWANPFAKSLGHTNGYALDPLLDLDSKPPRQNGSYWVQSALGAYVAGRLIDRWGQRTAMVGAMITLACTTIVIPLLLRSSSWYGSDLLPWPSSYLGSCPGYLPASPSPPGSSSFPHLPLIRELHALVVGLS